jgi:hypothetical protein
MGLNRKIEQLIRDGVWAKDTNGNCHTNIVGASVVAAAILDLPEMREAFSVRTLSEERERQSPPRTGSSVGG